MASVLKETLGLYETLKVEWNKKTPNLNKCGEILSKLKVLSLDWLNGGLKYSEDGERRHLLKAGVLAA